MTTPASGLEQRYRRWLRCYPKWFRAQYEAEVLGVLVDDARDGQCQPGWIDCLDLVVSALRVRLRPRVPRSERSVLAAIKAMWVGAAVELLVVVTLVATMGDVRRNAFTDNPGFTDQQWQAVVASQIAPNVIGGLLSIGFWACMAWSIGRGHRWTRIAFPVFFALNLVGLFDGLRHGAAVTSRPDLATALVLCCIELVAVVLVWRARITAPGRLPG